MTQSFMNTTELSSTQATVTTQHAPEEPTAWESSAVWDTTDRMNPYDVLELLSLIYFEF